MELELEVTEAYSSDSGRGIARLHPNTLACIVASPGDTIEIEGEQTTVAKARRADRYEEGTDTVRMDSFTRKNAGVGLSEEVTVRKRKPEDAEVVVLEPPEGLSAQFGEGAIEVIEDRILNSPVREGDTIAVKTSSTRQIPLLVARTEPEDTVIVTREAEVILDLEDFDQPGSEEESEEDSGEFNLDAIESGEGIDVDDIDEERLEGKIEKLNITTRRNPEETVEFSELEDIVRRVYERDEFELYSECTRLLDSISGSRVEVGDPTECVDLLHEIELMDTERVGESPAIELETVAIPHIVSSKECVDELVDIVCGSDEEKLHSARVLLTVAKMNPRMLSEHANRLFEAENIEADQVLMMYGATYPERVRAGTPRFFERFEQLENPFLRRDFCGFLASLSRADPDYASEWVERTLDELGEDELTLNESSIKKWDRSIAAHAEEMARMCPEAVEALEGELREKNADGVLKEYKNWLEGDSVRLSVDVELGLDEYMRLREEAGEGDGSLKEVIGKEIGSGES